MTRTQRSLKNFSSAMLLQVFMISIGFVSTPFLLQWLGDERFGAFRSTSDWMAYLQLLEFGLGGALLPLLAHALGKGDRKAVQSTLVVGIRAYLKVVGLMLVAGVILGSLWVKVVPIRAALLSELQTGYWIGLLNLIWLPFSPLRFLSDANQRSDQVNFAFMVQSLLITIISLYLAHQGVGIPGQFFAIVIGSCVATLLLSWQGFCQYPGVFSNLFHSPREDGADIRKQLYQLSFPTLVLNLSVQLALFTDNIVITYFLGPTSVVPFVLTQRLTGLAQTQVYSIGNSTWAALAELYTQGELAQFNTRLLQLTRLVAIAGLMLVIPIVVYNSEFVRLWVGAERFAGWGVSLLAAINAVLVGVLSLWRWCFSGTGKVAKVAPIIALSAGANFLISIMLTPQFKLIGPLLGTLISFLTIHLWGLLYHLKQQFGASRQALLKAAFYPFLLAMVYTPAMVRIAQTYPIHNWIELGIAMSLTAVLFVILAWFMLLKPGERHQWSEKVRQLSPLSLLS